MKKADYVQGRWREDGEKTEPIFSGHGREAAAPAARQAGVNIKEVMQKVTVLPGRYNTIAAAGRPFKH